MLCFLPAMSTFSRLDWMLIEQPCETQTLSNRKELKCAPSIQTQLCFTQSVLEALESKSKNFWNPRNARTSSCCFLHGRVEVNLFLRSLVLLCLRTHSASFGLIASQWTAASDWTVVLVRSGLAIHTSRYPVPKNDASSQTFVNWSVSDNNSKSGMFSRKLFPDASLGEDTKKFTSCEFTLFCIRLFTGFLLCQKFFLVPFRLLPHRIAHLTSRKLLRKYLADSENHNAFGTNDLFETFVRMVSFPFFFRIPRLNALALVTCFFESLYHLRCYWISLSFKRVLCFSIPLLLVSRTEERPASLRVVPWLVLNWKYKIHVLPLLVQPTSLNIDMKMIRSVNS